MPGEGGQGEVNREKRKHVILYAILSTTTTQKTESIPQSFESVLVHDVL